MEVKGNMLSKRRIVADEPYVPLGQKMAYPLELQKVANTLLQYVTTGIVIMLVLAFIFFIGAAQSNLGGNQLRLISVELGFIGV